MTENWHFSTVVYFLPLFHKGDRFVETFKIQERKEVDKTGVTLLRITEDQLLIIQDNFIEWMSWQNTYTYHTTDFYQPFVTNFTIPCTRINGLIIEIKVRRKHCVRNLDLHLTFG